MLAATSAVGAVYAIWLIAVSPVGEYPLNDDWAYAWSVRRLLQTGELRISEWASASAIFPVYWGTLAATLTGGFSFSVLRISTLVFSVVCPLALCWLLRSLSVSRGAAVLGAVTLAVNPLFFHLSYTFMTDVFFIGLMLVSLTLYVRGVDGASPRALWAGSGFAAAAYLTRQLGFALPVAAAVVLVARHRRLALPLVVRAVLLPALTVACHTWWLSEVNGVPWAFRLNTLQNGLATLLRASAPVDLTIRVLQALLYVGIFTLPAMVAAAAMRPLRSWREAATSSPVFWGWLVALAAFAIYARVSQDAAMPYLQGIISRAGIGAQTLPLGEKLPVTPAWVFCLATLVAPVPGAVLGGLWTRASVELPRNIRGPAAVLIVSALLMAVPTASMIDLWDEYLLVFVPASLYLVLRGVRVAARGWIAGAIMSALLLAYALPEQADYMAWNASRWKLGRALVRERVPPILVDGGFEWVGWFDFERALPVALAAGKGDDLFAWMSVFPDQYFLSFEPVAGAHVVASTPYRTWFGTRGTVLAVEYDVSAEAPEGP